MALLTTREKEVLAKYAILAADAVKDELSGYWGEAFAELKLEGRTREGTEAEDFFFQVFTEKVR